MTGPVLTRRKRAPRRIEIGTGEPAYPATTQDYYRQIYFESINLMVNAIEQRFDQPSFAAYANMQSLLVKAVNLQNSSRELQFMEISYVKFSICFLKEENYKKENLREKICQ